MLQMLWHFSSDFIFSGDGVSTLCPFSYWLLCLKKVQTAIQHEQLWDGPHHLLSSTLGIHDF